MRAQLNKLADKEPADWDRFLPAVVSAYNNGEHATTGITPFELMFGRPSTSVFDPIQPILTLPRPSDYLAHLHRYRAVLTRAARAMVHAQQHRMQTRYNRNRSDPRYRLGGLVLVRTPPPSPHQRRRDLPRSLSHHPDS